MRKHWLKVFLALSSRIGLGLLLGFGLSFVLSRGLLTLHSQNDGLNDGISNGNGVTDRPSPASRLTRVEQPVIEIPLTGAIADRDAELSGLAWYGDSLILLPQYPDRLGNQLFTLSKSEIMAFVSGQTSEPLAPRPIAFEDGDLATKLEGFEGYEAIAFAGSQVFLTIETERESDQPGATEGYVVTGQIAEDLSRLTVNPAKQAQISPQSNSPNKAEEALIVDEDRVISIYEVNGARLNPQPVAHVFDWALSTLPSLPFPTVEYRITDATALDDANRFWAINYFYPGDRDLTPRQDPLAVRYGQGATHRQQPTVERLVEFEYVREGRDRGITLTDTAPIQLVLADQGRNWEGIVRLNDQGFLLATDKFPQTILGYVAKPNDQ